MTETQFRAIVGANNATKWYEPFDTTCRKYEISTPLRQAHFLAQVLHETGEFRWLRELWGPTEAQKRYEGRADLGNTEEGDGYRYRGRGLIQLTGRANYSQYSSDTGIDFVTYPELLEQPEHAMDVAGWYWHTRSINKLADKDDVEAVTRRVNGGLNGLTGRISFLNQAKRVLFP